MLAGAGRCRPRNRNHSYGLCHRPKYDSRRMSACPKVRSTIGSYQRSLGPCSRLTKKWTRSHLPAKWSTGPLAPADGRRVLIFQETRLPKVAIMARQASVAICVPGSVCASRRLLDDLMDDIVQESVERALRLGVTMVHERAFPSRGRGVGGVLSEVSLSAARQR